MHLRASFLTLIAAIFSILPIGVLQAEESNLDPVQLSQDEADSGDAKKVKESDPLREQAAQAIEISKRRYLDGKLHTPWQILHGLLALRHDYQIKIDGEKTNAMAWIQQPQYYAGRPWVLKTRYGGQFHPFTKPYHFEGHPNQFLAILTLSDLPEDFTFQSPEGPVTIKDMVEHAKMTVNNREEITWTLWALSKYLPPDAEWVNERREQWSIEHLVKIQARADINDSACGGTHGLFALARARNKFLETGEELRGVWIEADQVLKQYVNTARALQYSDGTFSCGYFLYQDYKRTFEKRLSPTGHTLEFLMMAVSDEELEKEWIRKGVAAVSKDLIDNKSVAVDCGPLYHAMSGLQIYLERTAPKAEEIADAGQSEKDSESKKEFEPLVAPKPAMPPRIVEQIKPETPVK